MPTFTLELWRVLDLAPKDVEVDTWLGLGDYPLQAGVDREALNTKIKNHFMYQEIGMESVDQFRFRLRNRMHEMMPVYNRLFETIALEYDPFKTISLVTKSTGISEQTSTGESNSESNSNIDAKAKNVASAFPQVMLGGNKDYATSGADSNSETDTFGSSSEDSSASNTASSDNESETSGYQGVPAQLIQAERAAIINVEMLIIAELDPLFMMVWNNSDEYSTNRTRGRYF